MKRFPDFSCEEPLWREGYNIIGIDEVGRGAFAGPVGVGGVVFSNSLNPHEKKHLLSLGINDSKKLTTKKREELSLEIKKFALSWNVSFINVEFINKQGVGKATFEGMREVTDNLKFQISNLKLGKQEFFALVDGFEVPRMKLPQKGIVRGDNLSISIAAASIIAKVERDKLMEELSSDYPKYGWGKNKGYGTKLHREAITMLGVTAHHRTDFVKLYV